MRVDDSPPDVEWVVPIVGQEKRMGDSANRIDQRAFRVKAEDGNKRVFLDAVSNGSTIHERHDQVPMEKS